ncbi:MAG: CBS domain-containing protein [Candidatus Pacebacteria bacterium]|nr:CBS domain-containing protein [Candidatus Paceibacterota bacterium]
MKVKDIVKPAVIIAETDTFATALKAMINQQTNTLLVTNERGKLVGEITVADFLDAVIPDTLDGSEVMSHFNSDEAFISSIDIAKDIPVGEFMSHDFSALTLEDDLIAIVGTAIAHQRARIPVVDSDNRPVGIIARQGLKRILAKFMQ